MYVDRKTTKLYESADGGDQRMVLIFGDEVEPTGPPQPAGAPIASQRTPVTFRGRPGFIKTAHLSNSPALEMYFIDVGQGDSTFIVTPGRKKILIDGGANNRALGFLAWKYRLDRPDSEPVTIDLMAVSHADGDSTEIAATFLEATTTDTLDSETLDTLDTAAADVDDRARRLFKRRLHGMINVRSSGTQMYAARRLATGYWWESYGPLAPAGRSQATG